MAVTANTAAAARDISERRHEIRRHSGEVNLSNLFVFGGFIFLASAWEKLYRAQREHKLATTGAYAYVRHPQYVTFIVIMFGFLLQWPTLLTLVMFPVLVWMYVRLARSEERDALAEFGEQYARYAENTPAFIPGFARPVEGSSTHRKGELS